MDIDVVLPIYNEVQNLKPVTEGIEQALGHSNRDVRIMMVDDGSDDGSWEEIERLSKEFSAVTGLRFSENCGQSAAFTAGFQHARAPLVATMDADGQNDPADLPNMLDTLEQHDVDMVAGYRENRRDTLWKKIGSRIGNTVRNWLTGDDIIDTGCSLKLFRLEVVKSIPMFVGMHRFLPTLARMKGFSVEQVPVNHRSRWEGETSYSNLGRLKTTLADVLAVRWMQSRVIDYSIDETRNIKGNREPSDLER